jgi:uroporphyrinogen-III synthase
MGKNDVKKSGKELQEIKNVLITQPKPDGLKSPYFDLATKYGLNLHFHPFIVVEGISSKEFRKQKIEIPAYSAVIFTSRNE